MHIRALLMIKIYNINSKTVMEIANPDN